MRAKLLTVVAILFLNTVTLAQTDVIGSHDLSPSGISPVKGALSGSCLYCHAPHSGLNGTPGVQQTPLWNQTLSSVQTYSVYNSPTMVNANSPSPPLGGDSSLCLSCHDGTVAGSPGALVAYGQVAMTGQMNPGDVFGTDLSSMHPFSFVLPLKSAPDLVPSLTASPPTTADQTGAVKLIKGNVECTSCHNPHVQNTDPNSPNFLVIDNSSGALCLACHTTVPSGSGMGLSTATTATAMMANAPTLLASHKSEAPSTAAKGSAPNNKVNPLVGWSASIHATAPNSVTRSAVLENSSLPLSRIATSNSTQKSLGVYGSVAKNGCSSCHIQHGAKGGEALLRSSGDQVCLTCHNGSTNVSPAAPDILSEMTLPKIGHASSVDTVAHQENEAVLLNQNRHAACVDCHNPHSTARVVAFTNGSAIRASQGRVMGVSATDGITALKPANNQFENCLRCHGSSTGKQAPISFGYLPARADSTGDPLNIIPQFSLNAASSHPVFHDRSSPFSQPSLRSNMLDLDGRTQGRGMASRVLCTDCHNSDDNREFGGTGPNGPHGSKWNHILERRYECSQAVTAGGIVSNLFPNPDLTVAGPYALCAKCHDLSSVVANTSFTEHARHINDGFSCSTCHTAHGVSAQSASISGARLVDFDMKVVSANGAAPVSYNRTTNTCNLVCHSHQHGRTVNSFGKNSR